MKKVKAVIFAAALVIGFTAIGSTASANSQTPHKYCKVPCLETP